MLFVLYISIVYPWSIILLPYCYYYYLLSNLLIFIFYFYHVYIFSHFSFLYRWDYFFTCIYEFLIIFKFCFICFEIPFLKYDLLMYLMLFVIYNMNCIFIPKFVINYIFIPKFTIVWIYIPFNNPFFTFNISVVVFYVVVVAVYYFCDINIFFNILNIIVYFYHCLFLIL